MITTCDIYNRHGERLDHHFHPGSRADALVILGHGLTGNLDRPLLVALAEGLSARGWPCLRISYSGNGSSEGTFENSCITRQIGDLQSVLDAVPEEVRVAYVGHSMGGAVGVLTAARDMRIFTLVSLAGMTYSADFIEREFGGITPGKGVMWEDDAFPLSEVFVEDLWHLGDTLSAAEAVTQPWLLIHGAADDVVPSKDGEDAYAAATCEKRWVSIPGAGHSFEECGRDAIISEVDQWLAVHMGEREGAA